MNAIERIARAIYRQRLTGFGLYAGHPWAMDRSVDEGWPICATEARVAIDEYKTVVAEALGDRP